MTEATCNFDTSDCNNEQEIQNALDEDLLENGRWHCHQEVADDMEYCVFHRSPEKTDSASVAQAFQNAVRNDEGPGSSGEFQRQRRFIGAKLGDIPLSYANLGRGSNHPIDLRFATVEGCLDVEHATVAAPLLIDAGKINEFNAHDCVFEHRVEASASTIDTLNFQSATFHDRVNCSNTEVAQGKLFNATFRERLFFRNSTFSGVLSATQASFEADASFSRSTFDCRTSFKSAEFRGDVSFTQTTIEQQLSLENINVESKIKFDPESVGANVQQINLTRSRLSDGYLRPPPDANLDIDLSHSTIGTIELGEDPSAVDLQRYHLVETTFEGFDFSKYTDALVRRNWLIHPVEGIEDRPVFNDTPRLPFLGQLRRSIWVIRTELVGGINYTPGTLRSTYLKAKNGAKAVGDDSAAAEFFVHEMRYKRKSYRQAVKHHHSVWALFQWVFNSGYNLTAGYGERPFRTFLSSSGLVLSFAVIYTLSAQLPFGEALTFSFQAFVSLVLGNPAEASRFQLLAAVEAFIGAFMIALFVFTLTRSINR